MFELQKVQYFDHISANLTFYEFSQFNRSSQKKVIPQLIVSMNISKSSPIPPLEQLFTWQ